MTDRVEEIRKKYSPDNLKMCGTAPHLVVDFVNDMNALLQKLSELEGKVYEAHCRKGRGVLITKIKNLESQVAGLLEENEKLKGGYCTCNTLAHYRLFVEGDEIRHGDCGRLLSAKAKAALDAAGKEEKE